MKKVIKKYPEGFDFETFKGFIFTFFESDYQSESMKKLRAGALAKIFKLIDED